MNESRTELADAEEIARGRAYLVRALWAGIAVYVITIGGTYAFGNYPALGRALFKLVLIGTTGAAVLGLRWSWARWVLVALFLVLSLEWIAFAMIRDYMGMVAAPTHLACAAAVASRPARLYVQQRPSSEGQTDAIP